MCWMVPASPAGIRHWHNPDPWTKLSQLQCLCSYLFLTRQPLLCFTPAIVPECVHHSAVTPDQRRDARERPRRPVIPLHMHPEQQCYYSIPAFIQRRAKPVPFACVILCLGNGECKFLPYSPGQGLRITVMLLCTSSKYIHYMLYTGLNMSKHV